MLLNTEMMGSGEVIPTCELETSRVGRWLRSKMSNLLPAVAAFATFVGTPAPLQAKPKHRILELEVGVNIGLPLKASDPPAHEYSDGSVRLYKNYPNCSIEDEDEYHEDEDEDHHDHEQCAQAEEEHDHLPYSYNQAEEHDHSHSPFRLGFSYIRGFSSVRNADPNEPETDDGHPRNRLMILMGPTIGGASILGKFQAGYGRGVGAQWGGGLTFDIEFARYHDFGAAFLIRDNMSFEFLVEHRVRVFKALWLGLGGLLEGHDGETHGGVGGSVGLELGRLGKRRFKGLFKKPIPVSIFAEGVSNFGIGEEGFGHLHGAFIFGGHPNH